MTKAGAVETRFVGAKPREVHPRAAVPPAEEGRQVHWAEVVENSSWEQESEVRRRQVAEKVAAGMVAATAVARNLTVAKKAGVGPTTVAVA